MSCVVCSPEVFCKFTACKQRCPGLKLVIQFNSWPHNPGEEGRRHLETIKSLLLILRESQNLLSPNRNISEDASLLNDKILSFFQRITLSSVSEQENIFAVVKHHLLLSQENGLFNCFLSPPGSTVVDKEPSLITCHVNTMLLMSCMYHCYVMGCLPQPIAIGNHDSLVAVVYTSGSTGFAKGTCVICVSKCVCWVSDVCIICIKLPSSVVHNSTNSKYITSKNTFDYITLTL